MSDIEVGAIVRCPAQPDWGLGQVQSVIGPRVVVMFEERGKVAFHLIDDGAPPLELVRPPRAAG